MTIQKKGRLIVFITLLLLFVFVISVYADGNDPITKLFEPDPLQAPPADPANPAGVEGTDTPSFAGLLLRTVVVLAIILFLIYFMSKWINKRGSLFDTNAYIKMQSGINLGQNKSLRLVKVGSSYYLLGVANDITLLKEFSSEEEINEIEMLQQPPPEETTSYWMNWLRNLRILRGKKEEYTSHSFQTQLEDRLSDLRNREIRHLDRTANDRQHNRGE